MVYRKKARYEKNIIGFEQLLHSVLSKGKKLILLKVSFLERMLTAGVKTCKYVTLMFGVLEILGF